MQTDLPHTLYIRDEERKKAGGTKDNYTFNPEDPAVRKQMEAIRKKKERMEAEGKRVEYTMDEIFNRQ